MLDFGCVCFLGLVGIRYLSTNRYAIDVRSGKYVLHYTTLLSYISMPSTHIDTYRKNVARNRCVDQVAFVALNQDNVSMKPQQLATLLNISPVTLRQWARESYSEFLSPSAQGANGAHRSFTEQDGRILAWVAMLKAQNTPTADIVATLRSSRADNWRNLPPLPGGMSNDEPIAVVPREAVEERIRALPDRYETQLEAVVKERDQLKDRLEAIQREMETVRRESSAALQASQHQSMETFKTLQQRITELSTQEAELRGKLEQYMFGGRRLNAVTLVAIALLVGITIAVLAIAIGMLLSRR
jgi:DNA-binding transcriptional MerR regulator